LACGTECESSYFPGIGIYDDIKNPTNYVAVFCDYWQTDGLGIEFFHRHMKNAMKREVKQTCGFDFRDVFVYKLGVLKLENLTKRRFIGV
jgi:hypothetical protein